MSSTSSHNLHSLNLPIISMKIPMMFLICCLLLPSSLLSQQLYEVNNPQLDCYAKSSPPSVLGYSCNSIPSCQSFLTYRSQPPNYSTASSISSLLNTSNSSITTSSSSSSIPANELLLIPINCSCNNSTHYYHPTNFTILPTSTFLVIANDTLQGLSTCQSIAAQNPKLKTNALVPGDNATVPLRCACPTANQTAAGVKYLITYVVTWGDDVPSVAERFGADLNAVYEANTLTSDEVINPFTTLLIPVAKIPSNNQILDSPKPSPPPPPPLTPPAIDNSGSSSSKWVFVGIGIGVVVVVLLGLVVWYYFCCFRRRRGARRLLAEMPVREEAKKVEGSSGEYLSSSGMFAGASEIRGFVESLNVYKFGDLEKATGFFGEEHRIKGAVYRAVVSGDEAAVKRMKGDVSGEIRILKRINHSNVVRLSGFCVHKGNTYLVYEFVEKGSLADWIHRDEDWSEGDCVLGWKQRVRIAYDVADGLNYLHNYTNPPYIHKNLKSSNILLDSEFRAKLANFGLARPVEEEEEPKLTRHVVGTQGYMAPEYLEHGLVTPKLDVFAFGVVILELLSGKEATFAKDGEEKGEVLLWVTAQKLMSGEDVRTEFKDFIDPSLGTDYPFDLAFALAELAMRCITTDPGSRPSMGEVLMSLTAIHESSSDWDPSYTEKTDLNRVHGR